ncbi:MAG: FG-GAP-like repeat-containing protein [Candidatus Krumholzibacteria bacterium]
MRTLSGIVLFSALCLSQQSFPEIRVASPARAALAADRSATFSAVTDTIPDVYFVVFRFDFLTSTFVGVYEFSQPYRKSLPEPRYWRRVNIHTYVQPPGDFGYTDVKSRLTGERILKATTIWNGMGSFVYPPDSVMSTTLVHGFTNPEPDTLLSPLIPYPVDPDTAWALVSDTDAIARLASHGGYEVYAWAHLYRDGLADWSTAELFVLAATHPPAPDDMAILDVEWPRTLVTHNMPTTPEIVVHNFGDDPTEVIVRATMSGPMGRVYLSTRDMGAFPADSSRVVKFDPIRSLGGDSMVFDFDFLRPAMLPWEDAYPENDIMQQVVQVTNQPVFRLDSTLPPYGLPVDFDGDGDIDFAGLDYHLVLWQNDGAGNFTDISAGSPIGVRIYPAYAVCEDFNGDTQPDLFVSYANEPPQLLAGDGSGVFTDITGASGLDTVTTYGLVLALDKENDNDIDVIILSPGQETVLENDGTGRFTDVTSTSGIVDNGRTSALSAGDLNNDGYADVVMVNWDRDASVFINDGDGTFTKLPRSWAVDFGRDAALFDYDGDGDVDLLLVQMFRLAPSRLYRNNGGLTFEEVTSEVGGLPEALAVDVNDFNEDGRPDLVFSNGSLLMNTGAAFVDTSALIVDLPASIGVLMNVHFTDVDNDGDLDVYGYNMAYVSQGVPPITVGIRNKPILSRPSYLGQNFPNPFNPSTTIQYWIAKQGPVTLTVYNVAGQQVKTLVKALQRPATRGHIVRWDGRNESGEHVASGVYFYRLVTSNFIQTRKLVLLR